MLDLGVSETALEFNTQAEVAIHPVQDYEGVGRGAETLFCCFKQIKIIDFSCYKWCHFTKLMF